MNIFIRWLQQLSPKTKNLTIYDQTVPLTLSKESTQKKTNGQDKKMMDK